MKKILSLDDSEELFQKINFDKLVEEKYFDYIKYKIPNESNETFVKRIIENEEFYKRYVADLEYMERLQKKFNRLITKTLIKNVEKESNGESWIIVYGYDQEPYCNKGGWFKTEPYPFITSDGLNHLNMYDIQFEDIFEINDENFVTTFNKNKNIKLNKNGLYVLDRNKRLYKTNYPDVEKYDHIFIKHIKSQKEKI